MDKYVLLEIVDNLVEAAEELLNKADRDLLETGELIAYAEALCIIQDALTGYDLSEIGLDFDVDKHYLYPSNVSAENPVRKRIEALSMKKRLHNRLGLFFEKILVHDMECFRKKDGVIFHLSTFLGRHALVVEYAENYDEALLYRFEDGDLFNLDEMNEDELFQQMMQEIVG